MKEKEMGFIFDLDGTIIDDIPYILNIPRKVARDYNYPLTDELDELFLKKTSIPLCISGSKFDRFRAVNFLGKMIKLPFLTRMSMVIRVKRDFDGYFKNCPLIEGTYETLRFLEKKNAKIGIFTNATRSEIKTIFNGREEILDFFKGNIITKDDVKHKKPHPEGILKLISKWGLSPQKVAIIGDYSADIEAGKEAGVITIGVLSGIGTIDLFKKCKVEYILHDISEIPLIFSKFTKLD